MSGITQPFVVGLTGGIASGKSTVSRLLRERGAFVIDADTLAREVVEPGTRAYGELRSAFGDGVFSPEGPLDREKLAKLIFSDPSARRRLELIVHPNVQARGAALLAKQHAPIVVYDAALLVDTGAHRHVHWLLIVTCPEDERIERLRQRDGMSPEKARARIGAQLGDEDRASEADAVIDNAGSLETLREKVSSIWRALVARSQSRVPDNKTWRTKDGK